MGISSTRKTIRSIALPVAFSGMGLGVAFVLKKFMHLDLSKLELAIIAFLVTSACVLLLFPRVFRIPFDKKVGVGYFVRNVGLAIPAKPWKFVLLGILAALFTLSGMLAGSMLTGKYVFSSKTITLAQAVFSLTPGIWEEVLFRGVLMIVLLRLTRSVPKAFILQVVIFGIGHIKGADLLALVEMISVMVVGAAFTYIAYKTKSLLPGIVFHYLHDTFLFAVQMPDSDYVGFYDNALFYAALWTATSLCVVCVKLVAERFAIVSDLDFYAIHGSADALEKGK